jgi:hypothetical protein
VHFVLPRRRPDEPVANYLVRLEDAIGVVLNHPEIES